LPTKIG